MKTTLIVESHLQLTDFYSINLHTWVDSQTVCVKQARFLIEYLQNNETKPELIITKAKIGTEHTAEAIYEYLSKEKLNIPLIVIGDSPLDKTQIPHLNSSLEIKELIQASAKALNVTAKEMAEKAVPDFFEIPIQHFHLIDFSICNVFREEEGSFKLFIKAFDEISPHALKNLIGQGTMSLFVEKDHRLKFVTNINQEIASKLELKDLSEDEQVSAVEMSQQLLQEKFERLGVTPETVELAKRNMKYMVNSAKKAPGLKHLLKRLLKNKAGYQFKHSQILTFVSSHLMEQLNWGNDEQKEKMQFISFFHDITLQNSEQARIHSEEELKKSNLTENEKKLVRNHAQLTATLIQNYPGAPVGVEQIIKQHHGVTNGVGFSEHYSQNISPMAIVFILAEDLVESLIFPPKNFSFKTKISQMRKTYHTQRFQKIIDALETVTL